MIYLSDYDYHLPNDLIAKTPLDQRDHSQLLVYDPSLGCVDHKHIYDLTDYLTDQDVLILNDTKVLKARLFVKKKSGASIELLLLHPLDQPSCWLALAKPLKRVKVGDSLILANDISLKIVAKEGRYAHILFPKPFSVEHYLDTYGHTPLPPYLHHTHSNTFHDQYQTSFAKHPGAIAAPTAGRHFTPLLLKKLEQKGVQIAYLTLHVGYGTFEPIDDTHIKTQKLHEESYHLSEETAYLLNQAFGKKRFIAVGTTVIRALESNFKQGAFSAGSFKTSLFIMPGYSFRAVDGILTNFHLPKSSLLMLISAFLSREKLLDLYRVAISKQYRFFSFGDAMLIRP